MRVSPAGRRTLRKEFDTHDGFLAYGSDSGPTMTGIGSPPMPELCSRFTASIRARLRAKAVPSTKGTTPRAAYDLNLSAGSRLRTAIVGGARSSPSIPLKKNGSANGESLVGAGEDELGPGGARTALEKASETTAVS